MRKLTLSFSRTLTLIVVMCWILPLLILGAVISVTYRQGIVDKTRTLMERKVFYNTEFVQMRIDEAVTDAKKLTYDQLAYNESLQESWRLYSRGKIREVEFVNDVNRYMSQGFQTSLYRCVSFYVIENPGKVFYSVRDSQTRAESFSSEVREAAYSLSQKDEMNTQIFVIDNRIYIMRNMYTINSHQRFGTLVMELEPEEVFQNMEEETFEQIRFYFHDSDNYAVLGNTDISAATDLAEQSYEDIIFSEENKVNFQETKDCEIYIYCKNTGDYKVSSVIITEKEGLYKGFRDFLIMLLVLGAAGVPLLLFVLHFIRKQITQPVAKMVSASQKVRSGDIGHQITGKQMPNQEFAYLQDSFNKMSREVKALFEYTHQEEASRLDAKILALQSQINPHFLNNTLEMMNWQARMAGDFKTSKMIEALSTLLNYSMGRDEKRLCTLREELVCVDAYLYITSMRFGRRLVYEKEIQDKLLDIQVPQLILQPLLENAVVHGIEKSKKGTINLYVYQKEETIYLRIINTGPVMTEREAERIRRILDGQEQITAGKGKHVSLGIRNVNQRIQLIYGDEYGLDIIPGEPGEVISTIRIPVDTEYFANREKVMDKIWKNTIE